MTDPAAPHPLTGQHLDRADIERLAHAAAPMHLLDCVLDDVDLSTLTLTRWIFERCSLRRTTLAGARLDGTQWTSCRAPFASFLRADLSDARFEASDFNNAVFRNATLSGAAIARCKLTGADLSDAKAFDLTLDEVLLINAKMPGFSFRKQTLRKIDFSQADLRKSDFRATVFEACSLRDAGVAGCRFEGADLRGADLGGIALVDARQFRGATISREQAGQLLGELGLRVV
ncbi:pentapeptide repeat-containing protein [Sphingomonas echinoides]|uniref:pentapeptide repeat-containing protein n=1 Tax=Sphingomonas echinoides TaxID=59803 RepID=UPI002413169E|nr:pentapeptide repeat-containing protein [Sphingomonas echinoides]